MNRPVKALTLASCLAPGGCSIQPWVQPYERRKLADPIKILSRGMVLAGSSILFQNQNIGVRQLAVAVECTFARVKGPS